MGVYIDSGVNTDMKINIKWDFSFKHIYSTVMDRTYISAGLAAIHYLNTSPDTQLHVQLLK